MKKIWIGGFVSCSVHNETNMIKTMLSNMNAEITTNHREADIIIAINTCLGSLMNLNSSLKCLQQLLEEKKDDAILIASGCLAYGVKFELTDEQKNILSQTQVVKREDLAMYVAKLLYERVNEKDFDVVPVSAFPNCIQTSIVEGCLNSCSFCKSQYMNFDLKSRPIEQIESLVNNLETNNYPSYVMYAHSSNLSLYGVDLYGRPRAHEAIRLLSRPDQVKFLYLGALINWYPELINEILENPKIRHLMISIESGSPHVYKLMNRPIPFDELIRIIKLIRTKRPDIIIHTEFIAGFPTETRDDLQRSIDLAYELDICPDFIWPYVDSPHTASSLLPQHSFDYCKEAQQELQERLQPLKDKYKNMIENGEHVMSRRFEVIERYAVVTTKGEIEWIGFDQLDKEYQPGEIIPPGSIKRMVLTPNKNDQPQAK